MREEDQYHLSNIANYIGEIDSYVQDMEYPDFEKEEEVRVTVMENLQHIGQAATLLSDDFTSQFTDVDYQVLESFKAAKFNNAWEKGYQPIWGIIKKDLPRFRDLIMTETERMDIPQEDDLED
ncbi:MAG: HepT-like ribonuclease domain-containing protein [Bacteroidota bacterium]